MGVATDTNFGGAVATAGDVPGALRRYAPFAATMVVLILLTSTLVTAAVDTETLMLALGFAVILFAAHGLSFRPLLLLDQQQPWLLLISVHPKPGCKVRLPG